MKQERISEEMVPEGYVIGMNRKTEDTSFAHLYDGNFDNPGKPLCRYGYNRDNGTSYSIWRGNVGKKGICPTCYKRALNGDVGIDPRTHDR